MIVRLEGEKLNDPDPVVTNTVSVSPVMLYADALMAADPKPIPVNSGALANVVRPCKIKMFAGEMVALDGSLLLRPMNTPPDGAGCASVTGYATC
jgi:hypothetical protein